MKVILVDNDFNSDFIKQNFNNKELDYINNLDSNKRTDYVAGRIAIKCAYALYKKLHPNSYKKAVVLNNKSGVPFVNGDKYTFCSISHCNGIGIGITSSKIIGVDIEKIRHHSKELIDYISTDGELKHFSDKCDDIITLLWTIKEAVLKATGKGFHISPKKVIIHSRFKNKYEVSIVESNKRIKLNVYSYKIPNYYISVAMSVNSNEEPKIYRYNGVKLCTAKVKT